MQKPLSDVEWAYLAGIIDGEGSLVLHVTVATWLPRIDIGNTDHKMIEWIQERIPSHTICTDNNGYNTLYKWYCGKRSVCIHVLEGTLPYLITKKERATILLNYSRLVSPGQGNKRNDFQMSFGAACSVYMHALNQRGVIDRVRITQACDVYTRLLQEGEHLICTSL